MSFYNASQPINIQNIYTDNNVVEFLIKMPSGRALKAGSLRLNGYLKVNKISSSGVAVSITENDKVFLNQYAGVHSFFQNINSSVNNRTLESVLHYPRYVSMITQHEATPEALITNSANASELKGCLNNYLLPGNNSTYGIAFSMKPHICLNKSSTDLAQSKFSEIKISINLSNSTECLYISGGKPIKSDISSLSFELSNLQLSWMETLELPGLASQSTVFNYIENMVQTITGLNSNMQIRTSKPYNSISMSFLRKIDANEILYNDSLLSEYIPDINRVEFLVNGNDSPLTYAILPPCYQDIALNYYKSLSNSGSSIWRTQTGEKNSIMNRFLSENGTFGIGCTFPTSQNDVLQVALTIDDNTIYQPSAKPIQAYIYVNGYVSV
tara:strand:+ start:3936 stop:5087 length:1152 start_codon:yes stop_codon:yes gene_type:complete